MKTDVAFQVRGIHTRHSSFSTSMQAVVQLVGGSGIQPHNERGFAFCKDPGENLIEITGPPT